MGIFDIFKKKEEDNESGNFIVATLNDKIMPIDRGLIYEDMLDEFLQTNKYGEVTGGGTLQEKSGEIALCDIEILLSSNEVNPNILNEIISKLEDMGAPKGSNLKVEKTGETIEFGKKEGLAMYLDGINLPDEVYQECDSNYVASEMKKLTGDTSDAERNWQGNTETAMYFYSESFTEMEKAISEFINSYPLCKGARIEKIA